MTLLATRSNAATSTTENFFRRASAMSASRPGRLALFPETPLSLILLHDLIAALRRKLAQIIKLAFDMLISGAHADINGGCLH